MLPAGDPPHRYVFRLAALNAERITQAPKMTVKDMCKVAEPHILAVPELTGAYGRG